MKKAVFQNLENRMVTGDPGQNRTGDLPLRRRLLYPTELREQSVLILEVFTTSVNRQKESILHK